MNIIELGGVRKGEEKRCMEEKNKGQNVGVAIRVL